MYQVELKQSVLKDLQKIEKKFRGKIFSKIDSLKQNPYKTNLQKLSHTESYFRLRAGDYRIVFQIIDREKKLIIFYIRHRREVYRNL